MQQCNNLAQSSNDEGSDEEDDGTTCKICEIPRAGLKEKCGYWVQCDICDEYIYAKCYDKRDLSANDDFFVVYTLDHKCKGHMLRRLIMQ